MLKVPTYLDKSPIQGVGVFAEKLIPKGTLIWIFSKDYDRQFGSHRVDNLPEDFRQHILRHSFQPEDDGLGVYEPGTYILCCDNAAYMNHSDTPNVDGPNSTVDIALRDIQPGEEITCDYRRFNVEFEPFVGKCPICGAGLCKCDMCGREWCLDHQTNPLVCPGCGHRPSKE